MTPVIVNAVSYCTDSILFENDALGAFNYYVHTLGGGGHQNASACEQREAGAISMRTFAYKFF